MTYADGRYGALDIGTVTCRLLVADVEDGRIIDVDKEYAITDLGVGVDATGRLSEAAIERVLACDDTPEHPVRRLIAMATSASRDAANGPEFAARLAERGVTLAVIPGSREAQLTFLGASSDFPGENLLVVDIGGGTSEVAVISLGDIVTSRSARIAGDNFDEAIISYIKKKYNLLVGERTAEEIKIRIGSAYPYEGEGTMDVKGRNLMDGLPKNIEVSSEEIREALADPVNQILDAIRATLEKTPPELSADIIDHGIMLTGGGALLRGLDRLIAVETKMPVHVAENPLDCVVDGTGMCLESDVLGITGTRDYN